MVKRMLKAVKKVKGPSNRRVKSVDEKYYGFEPVLEDYPSQSKLSDAYNWYNYMVDQKQKKKWVEDYLKSQNRIDDLKIIKDVKDCWFIGPVGYISRILSNGVKLGESQIDFFESRIEYLKTRVSSDEDETENETPVQKKTIQDKVAAKINDLYTMAEEMLDGDDIDMYAFLTKHEASPAAANFIKSKYLPAYEEVFLDDPQVKESYGKKLKHWQKIFQSIIDDCDRYVGNKKAAKVRKPKTIKVKPVSKIVERLNYQKEFGPLKLVSINPVDIVGATQLWVYNTKSRILGVYNTSDGATLSVKGSTIINYDEKKSIAKRLRKPEEGVGGLLKAGKVILRTYLDQFKTTQQELNGRINKDTILLRVQR